MAGGGVVTRRERGPRNGLTWLFPVAFHVENPVADPQALTRKHRNEVGAQRQEEEMMREAARVMGDIQEQEHARLLREQERQRQQAWQRDVFGSAAAAVLSPLIESFIKPYAFAEWPVFDRITLDDYRVCTHERKRAARHAYERQRRHTNAALSTGRCKERAAAWFDDLTTRGLVLDLRLPCDRGERA